MIKKYFCRGENIKITNKLLILLIVLIACIGAVSASDDISDVSDNSTAVSLSYDEQNVDYSISNVDSSGDIAVANDWSGLAECISNEDSKIKLSGNTFSATSQIINHTGDSDTVYLTNGTYIFENNTFENSKQTNIGTNNIIIPTTSVNSIMSISLEEEDIIIQQVDDELKHVVYINGNINSATDCDGLSYETGFGYNGVNSINRFFANQTFTNGKDFSFSNITVYLADYTGGYYIQYTTGMGVATFIGQNRNNVTISNLNFAGYYGAEGFNMTFINLTIRLPDSKPSTVKIDIEGNFKFINCTFIYNKNVNAKVSNVININSNIAAEYYDNNKQIQDNIYTPEYHPSLSGFGHFELC